jgi:DNA adenine methylase
MEPSSARSPVTDSISNPPESSDASTQNQTSTNHDREPARPPLKWAGGKRWLVPHLARIWQHHSQRRYLEPFCGGLAAPLALKPQRALLNDINPHLINFYRQIQAGLKITIEVHNDENLFYKHRQRFNQLIKQNEEQTAEAAELFYFLNRTCFNGLCRFNNSGEFNVPFGSYKKINYVTDFYRYQRLLKNWTFQNHDLELLSISPNDFVYADPPYDVEFTSYSSGGFSWEDQMRTAELLAKQAGPVVLSNQSTPRIKKLYQKLGFTITYLDAPRRISATGDRSAAQEVLAVKNV